MLLNDEEVNQRLSSPLNLINRLRSASSNHSASPLLPDVSRQQNKTEIISLPGKVPSADDLIENLEEKLTLARTNTEAASIISLALSELRNRLPEIQKPERLASVAADMGKLISSLKDANSNKDQINNRVIVYAPQMNVEADFDLVIVNE